MSAIYFTSPSGEAKLRGSERAYAGIMVSDLTETAFHPSGWDEDPLWFVTPFRKSDYTGLGSALTFRRDFGFFLSNSSRQNFTVEGREVGVFGVCLNTVLAMGNDAICLLARLHGQCELHTWVDGPDRAWLAGIIESGRAVGILRPDQGWEAVATFLRSSDSEPVVTSYSVTDGFPNPYMADWTPADGGEDYEPWYDLPEARKWEMCMEVLRKDDGPHHGLQMKPDCWRFPDFYFNDGDTAFSVLAAAKEVAKAAKVSE